MVLASLVSPSRVMKIASPLRTLTYRPRLSMYRASCSVDSGWRMDRSSLDQKVSTAGVWYLSVGLMTCTAVSAAAFRRLASRYQVLEVMASFSTSISMADSCSDIWSMRTLLAICLRSTTLPRRSHSLSSISSPIPLPSVSM